MLKVDFELDPFQKRAFELIDQDISLFISAPTGAGKTLIAEAATHHALEKGKKIIYTAPIKALSNQKFRDFTAAYGEDRVGILTGDVSLNPDAEIVVMTTEIYRNSLFESEKRLSEVDWVIFDEVHYIDDPERGTVWEEALLFTPERIKILALSATIPNVHELSDWIKSIHDRPIEIITETHRPVPLTFLFQAQGEILGNTKMLRKRGYLMQDYWKLSGKQRRKGYRLPRTKPNRIDDLVDHLVKQNHFPCIYFTFGRKKTEILAWDTTYFDFLNKEEKKKITAMYDDLLDKYDIQGERSAEDMRPLIEQGIAFHHAGMLPTLKEIIERLFTSRLLKMIFTTETFALGINMPARAVVFDELEKYYGSGFKYLRTRDFYQMAGRAGRRSLDTEGYVYCRIRPQDIPFPEVKRIIYGESEKIYSQFNAAYATLLSLYRNYGEKLLDIYPDSLHYFQSSKKRRRDRFDMLRHKLLLLKEFGYIVEGTLTEKGEFASSLFGHELILSEMNQEGHLERLKPGELAGLMTALIFEPRKNDRPPRLSNEFQEILQTTSHAHRVIHKKENQLRIYPFTKRPHFHLAGAVDAWSKGCDFEKAVRISGQDEGSLVRYFRMVIQLLRELIHAPHTSDKLRQTASEARKKIDRDVIDAEKQLRV